MGRDERRRGARGRAAAGESGAGGVGAKAGGRTIYVQRGEKRDSGESFIKPG